MMSDNSRSTITFPVRSNGSNMASNMERPIVTVAGYIRVSTDMQAEFGLSLDAQESQIRRYAEMHNYEVSEIYVDHQSAKNTDRPSYEKMFKAVDAGKIDLIICTRLDRFSRSPRDFYGCIEDYINVGKVHLAIIEQGINTTQPATKMLLPLLIAVAQIERQQTAERVKSTIKYIREQGGHYGRVPFGYRTEGEGKIKRLVPYDDEHKWLDQMFQWYKEGKGTTEIARLLNENGVKPRMFDKWTLHSVYETLCKHGVHKPRSIQSDRVYDKDKAYTMAYALRSDQRTHSFIADALNRAGYRPKNAALYTWSSVQDLLRSAVYYDRATPRGYALYLKAQGESLRSIGAKLSEVGHKPKRGGQWHSNQVRLLLVS